MHFLRKSAKGNHINKTYIQSIWKGKRKRLSGEEFTNRFEKFYTVNRVSENNLFRQLRNYTRLYNVIKPFEG